MGTKHRRLIDGIASVDSLRAAYRRASNGKRSTSGYLAFKEESEATILMLSEQLAAGQWSPDEMRNFLIYEPKERRISAPSFRDRVVHHSIHAAIEPIFERGWLPTSFACRPGKGTHAGALWVQSQLRKPGSQYVLRTDFAGYFPNHDREILHRLIRRKIGCGPTLDLFGQIIPPAGVGIPIGALLSQLSANIYGNHLDQYLQHGLKVRWARYMDDVVVIGDDPTELRRVKGEIERFARDELHLELSRWSVLPASRGVNFLGYRIWATHKLLRKSSVTRMKRRLGNLEGPERERMVAAWLGHAGWADSHNLVRWLNENRGLPMKRPKAQPPRIVPAVEASARSQTIRKRGGCYHSGAKKTEVP